jgi:hypothetical protein
MIFCLIIESITKKELLKFLFAALSAFALIILVPAISYINIPFFVVLAIEPRVSSMLGKGSNTELRFPSPFWLYD